MTPEQRSSFIDALRSGRYKQGRGMMISLDGQRLCCLGVLCKINHIALGNVNDCVSDERANAYEYVKSLLGDAWSDLLHANDKQSLSFNEIADIVEGPAFTRALSTAIRDDDDDE